MNNDEELRALFKIIENDGKIGVNEINSITKKIEEANRSQLESNGTQGSTGIDSKIDAGGNKLSILMDWLWLRILTDSRFNFSPFHDSPKNSDCIEEDKFKYFPNKKSALNYEDFSQVYSNCMEEMN